MKKLAAILLLSSTLGVVPVTAAVAGEGCVTRPEYRRVENGMRQSRVRQIFDTPGERIHNGPHREEYAYDICPGFRGVVVFVTYRDNRVDSKSWILGE
jgi:hypothetical protein